MTTQQVKPHDWPPPGGLLLLCLALTWLGYVMPWVTHQSAALQINGFDLAEWMTFLPEVRSGSLAANRITQLVPLAIAVVTTAAFAWEVRGLGRWLLLAVAGVGLVSLLPGYPFILFFREDVTVQRQLMLAAAAAVLTTATFLLPRLPYSLGVWLRVALVAVGVVVAVFNFAALQPVVSALYGASIPPGSGLVLMVAGFVGCGVLLLWRGFRPRTG